MKLSNFRQTSMKGWFEYYRETCPICDKSGGCIINEKGDTVACIRIESNIQFSKGSLPSWIHRLNEKNKNPVETRQFQHIEGNKKAENAFLDEIYTSLLNRLTLSNEHFEHLMSEKRQMTVQEIKIRGYVSLPNDPVEIIRKVKSDLTIKKSGGQDTYYEDGFKGVPGFFQEQSDWKNWSIISREGFLIPYRNVRNQIVGFQTRADYVPNDVEINKGTIQGLQATITKQPNHVTIMVDGEIIEKVTLNKKQVHLVTYESEYGHVKLKGGQRYLWFSSSNLYNGTGAGNPVPIHIAVSTRNLSNWKSGILHQAKSVWVTEGALKGDITAEHLERVYKNEELDQVGSTVIAIPGVNTWREIFPVLEDMGVEHVNIAFDMDSMKNPYVMNALKSFTQELKIRKYTANIAMWNEKDGNGIDDLLINRRYPQLRKII